MALRIKTINHYALDVESATDKHGTFLFNLSLHEPGGSLFSSTPSTTVLDRQGVEELKKACENWLESEMGV